MARRDSVSLTSGGLASPLPSPLPHSRRRLPGGARARPTHAAAGSLLDAAGGGAASRELARFLPRR